jgi:glycerophosphoryl diester phosphodiesterase
VLRTLLLAVLLVLAAAAPAAAQNPWLGDPVLNMAHQGGEDELPSNTMYAFRKAVAAGADMLELDVQATQDGRLVVMHDWTVDRTTDGTGYVGDLALAQVRQLDAAHDFVPGRNAVEGLPAGRYPLRGVRTGDRRPPRGFKRADFRVPTLAEVMRRFPRTPINIEIKGRDDDEAQFLRNAELLAAMLDGTRRRDLIVVSFNQRAVDRFHELVPEVVLGGPSPGPGVVALDCRRPRRRRRCSRRTGPAMPSMSGSAARADAATTVCSTSAWTASWPPRRRRWSAGCERAGCGRSTRARSARGGRPSRAGPSPSASSGAGSGRRRTRGR